MFKFDKGRSKPDENVKEPALSQQDEVSIDYANYLLDI